MELKDLTPLERGIYVLALYRRVMTNLKSKLDFEPLPTNEMEILNIVEAMVTGIEIFLSVSFVNFEALITETVKKIGERHFETDSGSLLAMLAKDARAWKNLDSGKGRTN